MTTATPSYKGHRYPVEIINHCVWLYFRFPLSFREVEELMLVRGVAVSYETIRRWCAKFGQAYANQLRRRRPRPGDKWHLDEVFVGINGRLRYLWRAVDQHGNVLDVLVQSRRNAVAAKRFFRKLLKGLRYVPRVLVTDKLGSYQVAHREPMLGCHLQNRCVAFGDSAEERPQTVGYLIAVELVVARALHVVAQPLVGLKKCGEVRMALGENDLSRDFIGKDRWFGGLGGRHGCPLSAA